jgi:hypothetical protein
MGQLMTDFGRHWHSIFLLAIHAKFKLIGSKEQSMMDSYLVLL